MYLWRYELRPKEDASNENLNLVVKNDTIANTIEEAVAKIRKYQNEQHANFDIGLVECCIQLKPP